MRNVARKAVGEEEEPKLETFGGEEHSSSSSSSSSDGEDDPEKKGEQARVNPGFESDHKEDSSDSEIR